MSGRVLLAVVVAVTTTLAAFAQRLPQPASLSETVSWSSGVAYAYDPSGNIATAGADTYGYDGVGRLVMSTVNGTERRYAYDAHGNMISCIQWPDTPSASPCTLAGHGVSAATNRLTAAVDSDSDPTNDTHDGAGNVVRLAGHTYTYDALDMQVSDSSALGEREYVYDADGERIAIHLLPADTPPAGQQKLGEWRWTFRDPSGKVLREFRSQDTTTGMASWTWVRDYVWRDGQLLASLRRDASGTLVTYHYHLDHLGTPRRVTDDADRIVGVHDYHPFGVELSSSQDEPLGGSMRFTGHERDAFESDWATTLDYMHARFYSSAAGRFLSVDPKIGSADPSHPQTWNRYSYVWNNPLAYTDPTGKAPNKAGTTDPSVILREVALLERAGLSKRQIFEVLADQHVTNKDRYFFTAKHGWVDVRHFGAAAALASSKGSVLTELLGFGNEVVQWATEWGNDYRSGFSSEDLASNAAGASFGDDYLPSSPSAQEALSQWFKAAGALPDEDPQTGRNELPPTDPSSRPAKDPDDGKKWWQLWR